jgi:cyclohexadienyl dehydratase
MEFCASSMAESSLSFGRFLCIALLLALPLTARGEPHFTKPADVLDEVFRLADTRMSFMPGVAAVKWQSKAPTKDPERERAVITRAVDLGRAMGLAPEGVQAVFETQVRAGQESEERLHVAWRTRGYDFAGPIPSLQNEIRPQLDQITTQLLRALYLAAPALSDAEFATEAAARIQTLRQPGWTDADKRELLAALAKVRLLAPDSNADAPTLAKRIASAGVLRVGTTGDYAPFSVEQNGALTGSDIELAELLARHLGVTAIFVQTSWGRLVDDLRADRFDLAMGGVSVTPARMAAGSFSAPYSSGGKTILSRCEDAKRFRALEAVDRRGVRVIVNPGGTNEQYVRSNIHRANVVVFPDNRTIFDEIRARRADVMITDDVEVELQTHRHPDLCRAFKGTLTRADKAILMPKRSDLVGLVNTWLADEIKSGEPARLLEQQLRR